MAVDNTNGTDAETTGRGTCGIVPSLWFDEQAERAAQFYASTFTGGQINRVTHYPAGLDNPSGRPSGSVLSIEFEVAGTRFSAINGGPHFTITPSISFFVEVEKADDVERLFGALVDGGTAMMPLDSYPWSEKYAWVRDRFGTSWQIMKVDAVSDGGPVYPCLLFSDAQRGRAEEAIDYYVDIFPDSGIDRIERYGQDEGPENYIKHGRFILDGQLMVITDSHLEHGFSFTEGVSLQVRCADQASIDYYWERLTDGGEPSRCGWLKDRFGISWQVVPDNMDEWLYSGDTAATTRAFEAMLGMDKLDIAELRAAAKG